MQPIYNLWNYISGPHLNSWSGFKIQIQGHDYVNRARSHTRPRIQYICFLFISHQTDSDDDHDGVNMFVQYINSISIILEVLHYVTIFLVSLKLRCYTKTSIFCIGDMTCCQQ